MDHKRPVYQIKTDQAAFAASSFSSWLTLRRSKISNAFIYQLTYCTHELESICMKNLYFLCLAKQNFKLTVLSKGYILQFSFDPLFIKLLFKILKMKRNRQPSNLIIFISSYSHITLHPSYILISSVIVCTRASFFSDEAPQWWWCHTRSRAVPDTVYPQLDQNILLGWAWVWSCILKRHLLVLVTYYECYENYTLLPELWYE